MKVWRYAWCVSLFILFSFFKLEAQNEPEYEEISVFLMVQRVGGFDIPAVYSYSNQQVYLPVQDIFNFLKIKNTPSPTLDSVYGFFVNPENKYVVDKLHDRIVFANKVYAIKSVDIIRTETNLYLRSNFFGEVFGLDCVYNFRNQMVTLNTKIDLPVIRDMRLEFVRKNLSGMKGEAKADTTIGRSNPLFHFGAADWSVMSNQEIVVNNLNNKDTIEVNKQSRLNFGLGGIIAGGEAKVVLQYYTGQPFVEKQQQYLWRLVNNDRKIFRQINIGKIPTQSTSTLLNPVLGVQFTNAPTTYRRSFGSYTLSDYTEPDWAVELYVNNVLVDFKKADASGFFTFEVPLMYGITIVLLRFYGPYGEERSKQQNINIPYSFLPAKEFQYAVSAGMVQDTINSLFSRATVNYGINRFVAVGGGLEYLSTVASGSFMPFVNTSVRLGSNLLFSGEYTYGVKGKGILNFRTAKNFQVELNYTRFDPNQTAIKYSFLEERRATFSFPIKTRRFTAFSRFALTQNIMVSSQFSTAEWLLSGALFGVSTNFTTYAMLADISRPYLYSNLALGFRLPGKFLIRPQAQFEYSTNRLVLIKVELEKQFMKLGFLNFSYENNFKSSLQNIQFGCRFDLGIAQTALTYRRSNNINMLIESASGSLLVDRKTKFAGLSNRTSIGKGGIVVMPFIDNNGNGRFDKGEPKVSGLQININGGRVEYNKRDSVIRIFELEPYMSYLIELNKFSFDNIAWQMRMKNVSVMVDPDQFKLVEVPITVMGEAAGTVTFRSSVGEKGLGRVTICFYKTTGAYFAKTLSETDGYYSFMGLPSGSYFARIDPEQMRKLNMTATPDSIPFSMRGGSEGDYKDGLDFVIKSNIEEIPQEQKAISIKDQAAELKKEQVVVQKKEPEPLPSKESLMIGEPKIQNPKAAGKAGETLSAKEKITVFAIQVAASKVFYEPEFYRNKFKIADSVWYIEKDGWFKYFTGKYATSRQASADLTKLKINGFVASVLISKEDVKKGEKTGEDVKKTGEDVKKTGEDVKKTEEIVKTVDVKKTEEKKDTVMPAPQKKDTVLTQKKDTVLPAKKDTEIPVKKDTVLPVKKGTEMLVKKDTVLPVKKDTVLPVKPDAPPAVKEVVMVYTIQIAADKTLIDPAFFKKNLKLTGDVLYFQKDGWYKFVTGQYATKQEAQSMLKQLKISGFVTSIDKSLLKLR